MRRLFAWILVCLAAIHLAAQQPTIGVRRAQLPTADGLRFRDANHNGQLDPYEDWRRPAAERTRDLVSRMTLEEKAGVMMHGTGAAADNPSGFSGKGYDVELMKRQIQERHVNSLITRLAMPPAALAAQNNRLQEIAESTRLGIPVTVSSDPRHHLHYVLGAATSGAGFSQWPEALGFAALNDEALMRRFGDIGRQEYRAVGITMALSPQADLATEPRWPRSSGTFGEDPEVALRMTRAYIEGFQNGAAGLNAGSVAAIVKHFTGYGAAKDGWDSHNFYGRYADLSNKLLPVHIRPFEGAFAAQVAGVMPAYSILKDLSVDGNPMEPVGAGFNRWLLSDLLRGKHRFEGMVISDWAITNDCNDACRDGAAAGKQPGFRDISTAWGVESLSVAERFAKGTNAGIDQFGGTEDSASLVAAVRKNAIAEGRVDEAVSRILIAKFRLGLFENPYVDEAQAGQNAGRAEWVAEGHRTQARSMVLLENKGGLLPLAAKSSLFLRGVDAAAVQKAGFAVAERLEDAAAAVLRCATPHQKLHPNYFFGSRQNEGDLDFKPGDADWEWIKAAKAKNVPVVMAIYLDRPAILTEVAPDTAAILAEFGATDAALLDALSGSIAPEGRLPFELPRSMDAVRSQRSDTPHDSRNPLYPIFSGKRLVK